MSSPETCMTAEELDQLLGELTTPEADTAAPEAPPAPEAQPSTEPVAAVSNDSKPNDVVAEAPADDDLAALEAELNTPAEPADQPAPAAQPAPETRAVEVAPAAPVTSAAAEPGAESPESAYATRAVRIKTFIDADQLKRDVHINPTDLDNAMVEHASLFVHYASQAVSARKQYDRVKSSFEILEARLDAEYRETFLAEGKKVTEAQIKAAMTADKRWSQGQAMVIDAHSAWRLAEIAQSAFDQRKDLLLEVARDRRKEKEGQLRVLEAQGQRERVQELLARSAA